MKKVQTETLNPKPFLEKYGDRMEKMKIGNVIYVLFFGSRTRIQKTDRGYIIEPFDQLKMRK